ncbi:MAG: ABC transporter permease [Acetobacteraceae bacterium]|nr:ABC transporter permease [Acetobacteraceae bacterium]
MNLRTEGPKLDAAGRSPKPLGSAALEVGEPPWAAEGPGDAPARRWPGAGFVRRLLRNPLTAMGVAVVAALAALAVLAPLVAPYPEHAAGAVDPVHKLLGPSPAHPFGTDELGRDVLSRVLYGARISLAVGVVVQGLALVIGVPLGLVAGYLGGAVDEALMRVTDVMLAFPSLLLAMVICAALKPNLANATLAITIAWWPWYTRLARGQAVSVRQSGYVRAAEALGVPAPVIIWRHVLRNSLAPIIVQSSLDFGAIVLTLSSLSFLGLGAQSPTPEWGLMVSLGRNFFLTDWWVVVFPGMAIFATVLAFNLVGDGLREALDPRARRV